MADPACKGAKVSCYRLFKKLRQGSYTDRSRHQASWGVSPSSYHPPFHFRTSYL